MAAFLASEAASYITGQTIYVDGGRLAMNYTIDVPDDILDQQVPPQTPTFLLAPKSPVAAATGHVPELVPGGLPVTMFRDAT